MRKPVRIGIGGPVGSGKTALLVSLCRNMGQGHSLAAITNDIYTKEDAEFVIKSGAIAPDRVAGVETGGCPHTAIREDVSMNAHAIEEMAALHPDLDIVFVESGGDNLAATFSPELVDSYIYVIDVAEGDKIPRKGGPAITKSPLLVINKIDLAPFVGADLGVMERDSKKMRGERPFIFTNLRAGEGLGEVIAWIERDVLLTEGHGGAERRAGIQPDPAWIVGKHALMNVRATSRRGRTEIDPLCWRIPFQWQGYHYQDHDDQPFMLLLNSGGGFVEGDVAHFHAVLEPGTRALFTTTASSKFYKCPGGGVSREIVDFQVGADALLEFCPDEAIPFARSRAHRINRIDMAPTVAPLRHRHGLSRPRALRRRARSSASTIWSPSSASLSAAAWPPSTAWVATAPETIAALERLWQGRRHMATAFAYAPDLAPGVEDDVHEAIDGVDGTEAGVTRIGNLVIVRILSHETWQAHEALFNAWAALRPAVAGKNARPILKC